MAKYCKSCGIPLEDGARFCAECGLELTQGQPQPEYTPPPPQQQYIAPPVQQYGQPQYAPAGPASYAAPKKKLSKPLLIVIIAAAAIAAAIIIANLATGNYEEKEFFTIGNDKIPSVMYVLEEVREIKGVNSSSSGGVQTMVIEYSVTENQGNEMYDYSQTLMNDFGYFNIHPYDFTGPDGSGFKFAAESVDDGYIIIMTIDYDKKGYTLTIPRSEGTLTIHGGDNAGIDDTNGADPAGPETLPFVPADIDLPADDSGDYTFNVTSPDDFPFGVWTINQLTMEFGPPVSAPGYYIKDSDMVMVQLIYSNAYLGFMPVDAKSFSFYEETPMGQPGFQIADKDKDLKLDLTTVMITGPGVVLTHGIEVGKSTRAQIIASYGSEPWYELKNDDLHFMQYEIESKGRSGYISFYLDTNEVLESAMIMFFE